MLVIVLAKQLMHEIVHPYTAATTVHVGLAACTSRCIDVHLEVKLTHGCAIPPTWFKCIAVTKLQLMQTSVEHNPVHDERQHNCSTSCCTATRTEPICPHSPFEEGVRSDEGLILA